ncbi:hypothetical protein POM88_043662 [Heracleum sosnowskyi]|uniref:Uncharacterized protein n=1 Tax=Heracleum sosnowskyi TaxID=360622 RepID=A0AAD8H3R9_9APIA|nr:hypothetical protein POM88_043662 [Heracleum sosnowskyi]
MASRRNIQYSRLSTDDYDDIDSNGLRHDPRFDYSPKYFDDTWEENSPKHMACLDLVLYPSFQDIMRPELLTIHGGEPKDIGLHLSPLTDVSHFRNGKSMCMYNWPPRRLRSEKHCILQSVADVYSLTTNHWKMVNNLITAAFVRSYDSVFLNGTAYVICSCICESIALFVRTCMDDPNMGLLKEGATNEVSWERKTLRFNVPRNGIELFEVLGVRSNSEVLVLKRSRDERVLVSYNVEKDEEKNYRWIEGTDNDQVSSSRGNSDFGLWRGHEVDSKFLCLLDHIMNRYPETFQHFATKNKKFCKMKLDMLCTSVNDFTKISMSEVDTEMIAEYRDVFSGLQKFGFNVSWLVSRLNFVEGM